MINNPLNPMNPDPNQPSDPMNQSLGGNNPINPVYEETTHIPMMYKVILGVMGGVILIGLGLLIVFIMKANDSQERIDAEVNKALEARTEELKNSCELEKKDIRENPWAEFQGRPDFGTFKFTVPRDWAKYEYFDLNANVPYSLYFNPGIVMYDATQNIRANHSALEVSITKKVYAQEIKDLKEKIKNLKDPNATEETVTISNFSGSKFTYKDKELNRKVGVVILPYRDRAFFIKTDDYDAWNEKYYHPFWNSFALTP